MTLRAFYASVGSVAVAVLVGCAADPPEDLSHLPREASAVWGVDVGAVAAWEGARAPGPLARLGAEPWKEGAAACGLDLSGLKLVGAGTSPSDLVIVARAPGIGEDSTLSCLGAGAWREDAVAAWWTAEDGTLVSADGATVGRVISSDAVIVTTDPAAHDLEVLAQGSAEPWREPVAEALGAVDFGAAMWVAYAPDDVEATDAADAEVRSVAAHAQLKGGLVVHALVRAAKPEGVDGLAETVDGWLREAAAWVYASPSVIDAAEIESGDEGVTLRLLVELSQWRGMDLRFIDERRGLKPRAEPELKPEPEPEAPRVSLVERPALELAAKEVVAEVKGPTGIPTCDEYLEKYRRCVKDKMPPAVHEAVTDAMDKTEEAWKTAAASPSARAGLEEACKAASDAAAAATKAMGCTW